MSSQSQHSLLVDLPDSVLWSSRSWPEFATLSSPERQLVLLPVFGFADWGLGRSIDLEETLGCGVLRAMLAADSQRAATLSILPPLRFALGPYPHTLFGIDYETALDLVREIGASIFATGLRRLVLFNTSPWNEELVQTCAFMLRADLGLQTFGIHLEALGLDLHPTRSATRHAAQAAACALTRRPPAADAARTDCRLVDFRPGDHRQPPPLAWTKSLDASVHEGWEVLASAGACLARLLSQIDAHPPLSNDGAIPRKSTADAAPSTSKRPTPAGRKKSRRTP